MGAIGAIAEPLVVITLLFGGTYINRNPHPRPRSSLRHHRWEQRQRPHHSSKSSQSRKASDNSSNSDDIESHGSGSSRSSSSEGLLDPEKRGGLSLLQPGGSGRGGDLELEPGWRRRTVGAFGWTREVVTPDTSRFEDRALSRLLERFPFLVECWYWALIYWVYQLGRAFTATLITTSVVDSARTHALQLIQLEKSLHLFIELPVQQFFLLRPQLLAHINRVYSFVHIPGSIAFLVWLFWYTTVRGSGGSNGRAGLRARKVQSPSSSSYGSAFFWPGSGGKGNHTRSSSSTSPPPTASSTSTSYSHSSSRITSGPALYAERRRTMALSNLLAFVIFTLWPCMPPRLLSDPTVPGETGRIARSFGFVDTVHSTDGGVASVWTANRFCNQYAAMPSLHFGYALLIGLSVAGIPLGSRAEGEDGGLVGARRRLWLCGARIGLPRWDWRRAACVAVGVLYPLTILVAIVATANHFVLDAVAGAMVVTVAWRANAGMLNLLVIEDWFLWVVRVHKPGNEMLDEVESWVD